MLTITCSISWSLSLDAGLLGSVYLATFLISNVVTNNAAAALIFPIAMDAAEQTGTDRLIMSYCLVMLRFSKFHCPHTDTPPTSHLWPRRLQGMSRFPSLFIRL